MTQQSAKEEQEHNNAQTKEHEDIVRRRKGKELWHKLGSPRGYAMGAIWARRLGGYGLGVWGTMWIIHYWVLVIWLLGIGYMTMAISYG